MIINIKKFQDFKDMVHNLNVGILYRTEGESLYLYFDSVNLYCIEMKVNNEDGIDSFLDKHFKSFYEIGEL